MSARGTWTVQLGKGKRVSYDVYKDAEVSYSKEGCLVVSQYSSEQRYLVLIAVYAPKTWRRARVHEKPEDTA